MAQRKSLNPYYFNKPALHFYLRMPIVYGTLVFERLMGKHTSLNDIRTRDPYGLAGYSFTPSHPQFVHAVRLSSIIWNTLIACVVYITVTSLLGAPLVYGLLGAGMALSSPELLQNSFVVGVDTLMGLTTLLVVMYTLLSSREWSNKRGLLSGLCAGLACASKYNAAPIVIVPALYWWITSRTPKSLFFVFMGIVAGFFLGAPYSFLSFSEFLRGVSYEAWHYGIAGHAEHTTERGFAHAYKIFLWLLRDGAGIVGTFFAMLGGFALWKKRPSHALLLCAFPLSFIVLMSLQRVFFARNMLSVVSFFAIFAAIGVWKTTDYLERAVKKTSYRRNTLFVVWLTRIVCVLAIVYPIARRGEAVRLKAMSQSDSRSQASEWLHLHRPLGKDVAISGPLLFPIKLFSLPGVDAFNPKKQTIEALVMNGYDYFIVPTSTESLDPLHTDIVESISGTQWPQRIPYNPAISILKAKPKAFERIARHPTISFRLEDGGFISSCDPLPNEPFCWIRTVASKLSFDGVQGDYVYLEVMSPWTDQRVLVKDSNGALISSTKLKIPGSWESIPVALPKGEVTSEFSVVLSQVHSPESQGLSKDTRRLGLAVRPSLTP